jgi:uncharacterized cupin superfamily protein
MDGVIRRKIFNIGNIKMNIKKGACKMDNLLITNISDVKATHKSEHSNFEYYRKNIISKKEAKMSRLSLYEIPPGKAGYPYHYHMQDEETFLIIEGTGILTTPDGEKTVTKGDVLFFPPGENGAHMLKNISDTEKLVYLDFDVNHQLEAAFYPNSGKIGIWGMGTDKTFKIQDATEYYDGE